MTSAANGKNEPEAEMIILCCVRSQQEKCRASERTFTAAQQGKRSFMQSAA